MGINTKDPNCWAQKVFDQEYPKEGREGATLNGEVLKKVLLRQALDCVLHFGASFPLAWRPMGSKGGQIANYGSSSHSSVINGL